MIKFSIHTNTFGLSLIFFSPEAKPTKSFLLDCNFFSFLAIKIGHNIQDTNEFKHNIEKQKKQHMECLTPGKKIL